jgi:3-methylcrotonyl-CoA carboxylase alpha subunit
VFESILIANRGEIARRIMATCRRMGIRTVAVYSDADRGAPFVAEADAAYALGRSEPEYSYLDGERILAIAVAAGAQAVHPGYGFLSENAAFAETCAARGLVFIGPPPAAMRAMGLKHEAKRQMAEAGVRVLPGYEGEAQDPAELAAAAEAIGYPVLIKAVAGGGGKGMRRVDDARTFQQQLESAQREATSAFGDARVLIEKYLARSRHIEVQVFADRHGSVVHLFARDCSLQRRHQKVIEEAPPPGCSEAIERAACELAVRATHAVGYQGAGTIELIADVSQGLSEDRLYFMEMNTRLQVEHPVTELITGLDLVEWQLRVAAGEPLPQTQREIERRGHAIEARVYAEDPERNYMPQHGTLVHFRPPAESRHVRVDGGVAEGDTISVFYDAMLAKLIVWDSDRDAARRRLIGALSEFEIAGPITNLALLSALARHPSFAAGHVHTGFIEAHAEQLREQDARLTAELWLLACVGRLESRRACALGDPSPWADARSFRVNGPHEDALSFVQDGECVEAGDAARERRLVVPVAFAQREVHITLAGTRRGVRDLRLDDREVSCECDGQRIVGVYVEGAARCWVSRAGRTLELAFWPSPLSLDDDQAAESSLRAPLPGKIHAVFVGEGDEVKRGQPLLSLEAMKMEHSLKAERDGVVDAVHVRVGEQVEEGRVLLALR